jgi:hypothetical protein
MDEFKILSLIISEAKPFENYNIWELQHDKEKYASAFIPFLKD